MYPPDMSGPPPAAYPQQEKYGYDQPPPNYVSQPQAGPAPIIVSNVTRQQQRQQQSAAATSVVPGMYDENTAVKKG